MTGLALTLLLEHVVLDRCQQLPTQPNSDGVTEGQRRWYRWASVAKLVEIMLASCWQMGGRSSAQLTASCWRGTSLALCWPNAILGLCRNFHGRDHAAYPFLLCTFSLCFPLPHPSSLYLPPLFPRSLPPFFPASLCSFLSTSLPFPFYSLFLSPILSFTPGPLFQGDVGIEHCELP